MNDARHWLTSVIGLSAVFGIVTACPLINDPNHCANMSTNPCVGDQVCDPCTPSSEANGCVAPDQAVCSGESTGPTTGVDPTVGMDTETTTEQPPTTTMDVDTTLTSGEVDTSTTTGEPQPCMNDDDCAETPSTPFCSPVLQECVTCEGLNEPDAACANQNAATPACQDGVCVQCNAEVTTQCTGETPICNEETHECIGCTAHEQCGEFACNLFTGACVAGPRVTVGPGQAYATLGEAVDSLSAGGGGTIIVFQDTYDEAVTVDGGDVIAFLANGSDRPTWQRTLGVAASQIRVTGGATVLMEGFDVRNNPAVVSAALWADGGSLWVDRGIVAQNDGFAVSADSTMNVHLRNCFLAGANDAPVLSVTNSAVVVEYSTVGANLGNSTAITCDAGSDVEVSDSIIITRGGLAEVDCATLTATFTASNTALPAGSDNQEVGATMTAWFTAYTTGDFHLTPGAGVPTFTNVAEWNTGDVAVDIDDMPRSGVDGTREPAGADLP